MTTKEMMSQEEFERMLADSYTYKLSVADVVKGVIVKKEKDGYYGEVKVLSKGNSRIRYSGILQVYQGKKIIEETSIVSRAVGDNNYYIDKFKISTGKIEKDGDYTARVILSYFDENGKRKIMKQETNFSIKGSL